MLSNLRAFSRPLLGLGLLLVSSAAHADVLYSFSATGTSVGPFGWSFTEPSLITSNTSVTAANLTSVTNPAGCAISSVSIANPLATSINVFTNFSPPCGSGLSSIGTEDLIVGGGPINHIGTFGTLVVSAVPEPSSLILLGAGALGLFGPIRRKLLPWK